MNHRHAGDFWCIVEDITVPDMVERRGPKENWGITEGKARRILNLTDDSEKPVGRVESRWSSSASNDAVKVWVNGDLVNHGTQMHRDQGPDRAASGRLRSRISSTRTDTDHDTQRLNAVSSRVVPTPAANRLACRPTRGSRQ